MKQGWTYKKLGELVQVLNGYAFKSSLYENQGIRVLRITNVQKGNIVDDDPKYYPLSLTDEIRNYLLKESDLLMSLTGNVGRVGLLTKEMLPAALNQRVACLRILSNGLNLGFLFHYLNSDKFEQDAVLSAKGIAQKNMSTEWLKDYKLPLPPISVQQSIVSELDKINELIRLKKEQLKDYDNLAQSIFYEMFGDPVENEKGWEVKKLIETVVLECTISYGIVQPGDGVEDGIPVVRPIDLTGTFVSTNNLKKTTEKISSSYSRTILTGKELLVCVRGTTGVCSLVTDELKGCNVTRGITPLLFNDNTDRWFMYYQFQMPQIKCIIADYTKGITLKQINMADFRKIPVILPPLPLQQLFAQRIELIEKQKAEVQRTIKALETLLASRMQYWFD